MQQVKDNFLSLLPSGPHSPRSVGYFDWPEWLLDLGDAAEAWMRETVRERCR